MSVYRVGIVGGTGYAGGELLRILLQHPHVEVVWISSRSDAGKRVDAHYPSLRGATDLVFEPIELSAMLGCDILFFATPHGTAMEYAPALLAAGVKVIDLSADFRLQDISLWEQWYQMTHTCPDLVPSAVYGLPEKNRVALNTAHLVACPGCYPTAIQLALMPLVEANAIKSDTIVADAKSGVSGAGRQAKPHLLLTERTENFAAYALNGHRHLPEIEQGLMSMGAPENVNVTFIPHLVPMVRGIEATVYAQIQQDMDFEQLYRDRYADEPCVDLLPSGHAPETKDVKGTNLCRLSIVRPQDRNCLVITSVIDNLVKGAAGQAVQCMNIMEQLPEMTGLSLLPVVP